MIRVSPRITAALMVAAAAPALAADLTIVSSVVRSGDAPVTVTSYLTSDRLRMAQPGGQEIIVDAPKGEFTMIDNARKEYSVFTKQDLLDASAKMQEQMKKMSEQMAKMEEQMKNMPPAIREKMQALSGGGAAALIDVKKGSGSRTIAGYTCQNWVVTVGEISRSEECLSTEVPVPTEAWQAFQDLAQSMKAMTPGPMQKSMTDLQEKMKELKGFPLARTVNTKILNKSMSETSEVTEIKKGAVPATAFDIPAGYKKKDSPFKGLGKK